MTSKCILLVSFYLDILISAGVWKIKSSWERFQLIAKFKIFFVFVFFFCICLSKSRKQTPAKCRLTKIAKLSTKAIYQIFTDIPANVKTTGHVTMELRGNCTICKLFNNLNNFIFLFFLNSSVVETVYIVIIASLLFLPFLDTDDCDPHPCVNNGTCTDMVNNYTCACQPGFEGRNCTISKFAC